MVQYRSFVVYSIKLSLCNNLVDNFVNYVRDQLARKWRAKLSKTLQDEYFASANYYHAEQHMKDSDVRMTEDVKSLAEGFTEFFTAGTYTATTGVFYSLKVFWEFGFFYMSAPYIYFFWNHQGPAANRQDELGALCEARGRQGKVSHCTNPSAPAF